MEDGARMKRQVSHLASRHHISDCFPHSASTLIFTYSSCSIIFVLRSIFVLCLSPPDKSRFPALRMQFPFLLFSKVPPISCMKVDSQPVSHTADFRFVSRTISTSLSNHCIVPSFPSLVKSSYWVDTLNSHLTFQPNSRLGQLLRVSSHSDGCRQLNRPRFFDLALSSWS